MDYNVKHKPVFVVFVKVTHCHKRRLSRVTDAGNVSVSRINKQKCADKGENVQAHHYNTTVSTVFIYTHLLCIFNKIIIIVMVKDLSGYNTSPNYNLDHMLGINFLSQITMKSNLNNFL